MKDLTGQEVNEGDIVAFSHNFDSPRLFLGEFRSNNTIVLINQDKIALEECKHQNIPFVKMTQIDRHVSVGDVVLCPNEKNQLFIGEVTWIGRATPAYKVLIMVRISNTQQVFVLSEVAKLNTADIDTFTLLKLSLLG